MKTEILKLDTPTRNGRIYSTAVLLEAIEEAKSRTIYCVMNDDDTMYNTTIDINKICGIVENLEIIDESVVVTIKMLDTPTGKIVNSKMVNLSNLNFTPIGFGMITDGKIVSEYKIHSINVTDKAVV